MLGVRIILIEKIPSAYLTGIDLRSTVCHTDAYTTRLVSISTKIYILLLNFNCKMFLFK